MAERPRHPTAPGGGVENRAHRKDAGALWGVLALCACAPSIPAAESTPTEPRNPVVRIQQVAVVTEGFDLEYAGSRFAFPDGFPYGVGSGTSLHSVKPVEGGYRVRFLSVPDRGPNENYFRLEGEAGPIPTKLFLPVRDSEGEGFHLSIATVDASMDSEGTVTSVKVVSKLTLRDAEGQPLTGFPLALGTPGQTGEVPVGDNLQVMERASGYDPEYVTSLPSGFTFGDHTFTHGGYVVGEEYGPFVLLFDAEGKLVQKLSPGDGLPNALRFRVPNRGIEGGTYGERGLWSINQSGLNVEGRTKSSAPFVPLVLTDPKSQTSSTYMYPIGLGESATARYPDASALKIGDLTVVGEGRFLAIEQGKTLAGDLQNWLVLVSLEGATPVPDGLEMKTPQQISAEGFAPARIARFINLSAEIERQTGASYEKYEGLFLTGVGSRTYVVVCTDPDFGLTGRVEGGSTPDPAHYTRMNDGTVVDNISGKPVDVRYIVEPTGERPQSFWIEVTGLNEWFASPPMGWDDPWGGWPSTQE